MNLRSTALVLALAIAAGPASAEERPKAVVELFTSQGCASCPPADSLLTELSKDPTVIALTLPVDYWDYIGWKDTLALHGHSLRQRAYAAQRPDRKVFTPQVVVNGTAAVKGSDRAAVQRAILSSRSQPGTPRVQLTAQRSGDDVELRIAGLPDASEPVDAEVWACPVARTKDVPIGRGENGGRNMTYSNVVRGWVKVGAWNGQPSAMRIPVETLERDDADMVVFLLQSGSARIPGPILGATTLPLDSSY